MLVPAADMITLLALMSASPALPLADGPEMLLLEGARRAYNEKNYPFAAGRFREFLEKFNAHREADSARYGLALCLLEGTPRDPDKAMEQLGQLLPRKSFPLRPFVLYYSGVARRAQGLARPAESKARFEEAARHFADAAAAFAEADWACRARCEQAEMLLRLKQAKAARQAVAGVLDRKEWQQSRYHPMGHYYHGFASFLLDDLAAAGKSLSRTSVLIDEAVGSHARYLLGRVYHLNTKQDEREEARQAYQAVVRDHEAAKKAARERLGQPLDAETKARLERLARGPTPDHVARAGFFLGLLQYEDGRFAEALDHFKAFAAANASSPLAAEARLRLGSCQVQLRQFDDALRTLQPLAEKEPSLAEQALHQAARALAGKGEARQAAETFRRAADRAGRAGAQARRGDILADLAEMHLTLKQPRDAAGVYSVILQEKLLPAREDEVTLHLATALQLDGDLPESDRVCARFLERFKDSPLAPAALFRQAENSALLAARSEKSPNPADRARHADEAIRRYAALLDKHPDHPHANLARLGLGLAYHRKGDLDKAQKALEAIPPTERVGDLAAVSYSLADIYLRQVPSRADDAVAAGKMEEKLRGASEQLEAFLAAAPDGPLAPDALLKLGHCQLRMAKLLAAPEEQRKALAAARATYGLIRDKFPASGAFPQALFERAKVHLAQGEAARAQNELRRFATEDRLRRSSVAPMALLHLATIQRSLNRPAEAAATLAECRKAHEASLTGDRAGWATLLQYHHAAALREAGKLDEARQLFEQVARTDGPEGWDAALRAGQCRKDAGEKMLAEGKRLLAVPNQRPAAEKLLADAARDLREAVSFLASRQQALKSRKPAGDDQARALAQARGRMLYDAAWGWRLLAEQEVESALLGLRQQRHRQRAEEAAKLTPPGQAPPPVPLPEVRLAEVPLQPAEQQARERYQELIQSFLDLPLAADARFELAELLCQRDQHDEAVKLLQAALEGEKEPPPDLTEKIKLRLGACLLERGARKIAARRAEEGNKDVEAALEQLQPVAANEKSPLLALAVSREGECQLQLGKLDDAIKVLSRFRDQPGFQNVAGVSDRALLRLGWALAQKKQWDASRQAYEALLARFAASPWRHEARYGVGWAHQNQGRYDQAVGEYQQVAAGVATELGARAQLNVGLCRLAQKRYPEASTALLVVPYSYDYPELTAVGLLEAARAFAENKQADQAAKLLRRVLRDHAGTAHADAAKKRLAELGEG